MTKDNPLNLPWFTAHDDLQVWTRQGRICVISNGHEKIYPPFTEQQQKALGRYIVHACNMHHELVSAIEELLPYLGTLRASNPKKVEVYTNAKQLLERAKQ